VPNHTYKRMEKPCTNMDPHPRHEDQDQDHDEEGVLHSVSASVIAKTDQNQNEDGHRTGRSTSMTWFSSLTRKSGSAVKITSPKKRSFSNTLSPSRRTPEPSRLNNSSDWDLCDGRQTCLGEVEQEQKRQQLPLPDLVISPSKSAECLDSSGDSSILIRSSDNNSSSSLMSNDNSRSRANSSLSNILTDILSRDQSTVLDTSLSELAEEEEVPKEEVSKSRRGLTRNAAVIRLANHSSYSNISSSVDMESLDSFVMDDDRLIPNRSHSIRTTDSSGSATIDRSLSARSKRQQKDRLLLHGVKQFNLDPLKGLKLLEERGFLEMTPESVAQFLFRQERLSKKQIGTFLGSHQDFNKQVLSIFVNLHQFSHLLLVQALRQFLWSFRLPGEAMQIDRVMDSFAAHYCAQNPNIFEERDTCFILSFSIIMLNTALHNPNAKIKISAEQFVKQNRGINSGRDLPNDMLEAIYRNIKEEPFKIPDETYDDLMYTFFSPEREGWLEKQGGNWKNWKRRWFVLNDRCLYYFQHTAENAPKGIIPLEGVKVRPLPNKNGKDWVFEIFSDSGSEVVKGCKTDSHGAVVQGNHKHYRMAASTQEERDHWMSAIEDSIEDNPFCRIIEEKKASRRHMELNGS